MRKTAKLLLGAICLIAGTIQGIQSSSALTLASSNADATGSCTQNFTDTTYVTIYRYSNECVLIIKNSNNTTGYSTTWTVPSNVTQIKTLLVGGGGGGSSDVAGGGGGGQVRLDTLTVSGNSNIAIVVGKGGSPGSGTNSSASGGAVGDTSSVTVGGTATSAIGGGGGANRYAYVSTTSGFTGGGGSYSGSTGTINGTTGVGGSGYRGGGSYAGQSSGGGGGAGGPGDTATSTTSGAGGPGVTSDLSGTATCYGGGGSGGAYPSGQNIGTATCGGSIGTLGASANAATQNTGGGGGGQGSSASGTGGQGGSGIVVIRFSIGASIASTTILNASNTKKLTTTTITATLTPTSGGTITFYANGRKITRCIGIPVSSGTVTCSWKPLTHGNAILTAVFNPTDTIYIASTSSPVNYIVGKRTTPR